jgi:hypothetical protein
VAPFVSLLNEFFEAKVTESGLTGPLIISKAFLRKMIQRAPTG